MKTRKTIQLMAACLLMAVSFNLASCEDTLDVQQQYPFTVEAMPVADEITKGETVEIRLEIKAEGDFDGTVYTLRYFQPDGDGNMKMANGTILKPNDRYLLEDAKFRLYYTSESVDEAQTIDLYFENNWGDLQMLSFDFNAEDSKEEEVEE